MKLLFVCSMLIFVDVNNIQSDQINLIFGGAFIQAYIFLSFHLHNECGSHMEITQSSQMNTITHAPGLAMSILPIPMAGKDRAVNILSVVMLVLCSPYRCVASQAHCPSYQPNSQILGPEYWINNELWVFCAKFNVHLVRIALVGVQRCRLNNTFGWGVWRVWFVHKPENGLHSLRHAREYKCRA